MKILILLLLIVTHIYAEEVYMADDVYAVCNETLCTECYISPDTEPEDIEKCRLKHDEEAHNCTHYDECYLQSELKGV